MQGSNDRVIWADLPSGVGGGMYRFIRPKPGICNFGDCATPIDTAKVTWCDEHRPFQGRTDSPSGPPAYYLFPSPLGDIQPYMLAEHLPYHAGTALVYVARAGRKPGVDAADDIQKAIDHLRLELERLKAKR